MSRIVLLGPQRSSPAVGDVVRSWDVDGPVATITAGWQEREPDDAELDALLDGRSANLGLFARLVDVAARDPEFAAADRRRRDVLDELQQAYLLQLDHAMTAVTELQRRVRDPAVAALAITDALEAVQALDARHLERVAEVHADFHERWPPQERPVVAEHRDAVARVLDQAGALAIAGGHVGMLLVCLHLFDLAPAAARLPLVAWSAGAMAIAETVVLFSDRVAHGPGHAEVYEHGLGLCRDVVPLPHARRRLRTGDARRMALLARRFAPARCLILDDGARVDCDADGRVPADGPVVGADGRVVDRAA